MKPDRHVTEAAFMADVRRLAKQTGWLEYHTYRSRRSPSGYPDLHLVRPPRTLFAELKATGGEATPPQVEWLRALDLCPGTEAYLWTPDYMDRVAFLLSPRYVTAGMAWTEWVARHHTPASHPPTHIPPLTLRFHDGPPQRYDPTTTQTPGG